MARLNRYEILDPEAIDTVHAGVQREVSELLRILDRRGGVCYRAGMSKIQLPPLVEMKLNSWHDIDRTHLRNTIAVGLIDSTWTSRFQPALSSRLQELLDDPGG